MALAAKIAVFTLLLNISAGILGVALEPYFHTQSLPIGFNYTDSGNVQRTDWNGTATTPSVDPSSGWWIKFLDFITLGFVQKFQTFLDHSLYGITGLFQNMGILAPQYYFYFDTILSIVYMIGIIEIFTNKYVVR